MHTQEPDRLAHDGRALVQVLLHHGVGRTHHGGSQRRIPVVGVTIVAPALSNPTTCSPPRSKGITTITKEGAVVRGKKKLGRAREVSFVMFDRELARSGGDDRSLCSIGRWRDRGVFCYGVQ